MSSTLYALIAVIAAAGTKVTLKACTESGARPYATLILYNLLGALFILLFGGIPEVSTISPTGWILLSVNAIIGTLGVIFSVKSYETIDASSGEIFGTLTFILTASAGVVIFNESFTAALAVGGAVMFAGMIIEAGSLKVSSKRGAMYQLLSALLFACIVILDKRLCTECTPSLIAFSGFFVPGIIFLAIGRRSLPEIIPAIKRSNYKLLLVPLLSAVSYTAALHAYSAGSISVITVLFQLCGAFALLFELVLKRNIENLPRRSIATACCIIGAILGCS